MKKTILEAKNLCKSFANEGTQVHILNNIDLKLYEGDFTVVMGASGSGKSTLLYNISGMDKPSEGSVIFNDEDITGLSEKKLAKLRAFSFGFVFQQIHLVNNLTLLENTLVPGYMDKDKTKQQVQERADMLFEKMSLLDAKDRLPSQVSGGEAQRAAVARAVINEPAILFADEPTGALNRSNTGKVLDLMSMLNKEGQSILMVTHDIKAALRANRLIYIEDGKIGGEMELKPYFELTGFDMDSRFKVNDNEDKNSYQIREKEINKDELKDREAQVNSWLSSMNW
ncbi:MAG: ABC transporter ATP-binding protein [Lachnospiraceae bacterium]|nr:ABC transporter ATP-binding protein [Lachnospiraceae bacterium]